MRPRHDLARNHDVAKSVITAAVPSARASDGKEA
jgi:hypothetical protein